MLAELDDTRKMIDEIDDQLLQLLNIRADLVLKVGALKSESDTEVVQPERENAIIQRLSQNNAGPLSDEQIEILFRQIFKISYELEE